jgi:hypothetical protein
MEPTVPQPRAGRGPAAVEAALLASGAFCACAFHCPACGLAGTSVVRHEALAAKACLGCGGAVVVTVTR